MPQLRRLRRHLWAAGYVQKAAAAPVPWGQRQHAYPRLRQGICQLGSLKGWVDVDLRAGRCQKGTACEAGSARGAAVCEAAGAAERAAHGLTPACRRLARLYSQAARHRCPGPQAEPRRGLRLRYAGSN